MIKPQWQTVIIDSTKCFKPISLKLILTGIVVVLLLSTLMFYWGGISNSHATPSLQAKIVDVIDGDTLVIFVENKDIHRLRLAGINAPEINNRLHKESTTLVRELIENYSYEVITIGKDHYDRYLASITLSPKKENNQEESEIQSQSNISITNYTDLGLVLLTNGYAKTSRLENLPQEKQDQYRQAQKMAKERKLGIWKKSF